MREGRTRNGRVSICVGKNESTCCLGLFFIPGLTVFYLKWNLLECTNAAT